MRLDPSESRLHKLSVKYLNAPKGVRMKSWALLQVVLSCRPKPVHAKPLPFLSSPSSLSKTRVRVFPLYKYNGHEIKNELTWWLSWRARARVMGPSGAGAGVDVSLVLVLITQTLCNTLKHEFMVQWDASSAFVAKNYNVTSWHELLHLLHQFNPFCTEFCAVT